MPGNSAKTNFPKNQKFTTSYGRVYTVLSGPHADNASVWYCCMDEQDELVRLVTEKALQGFVGRRKDEKH